MVDKVVCSVQRSSICRNINWDSIFTCRKSFNHEGVDVSFKMPSTHKLYGGGPSLFFSSDELLPYTSTDLYEKQYKFLQCVKTEDKQTNISDDETTVLCAVPLSILVPKLTMKCIKDLATLHQIYIPSKTLVKNAQLLLQDHKCHKCDSYISLFEPYKVQSNAQHQQNWYKKLEPDEKTTHLAEKAKYKASSKYQEKIPRSIKLIIGPGKKSSFLQLHLLQIYVKRLCQISVLILLLRCLKKLVAQFVEN